MTDKLPVAVLGATGPVGQRFVARLVSHPLFSLAAVVASDGRAGAKYNTAPWTLDSALPEQAAGMVLQSLEQVEASPIRIAFSALPSGTAGAIESRLVAAGWKVFTNARDHRLDLDVPLLVPEINADHLALVKKQKGPGYIVANGNCSAIVLQLALAPLRSIGIAEVHVTTLQGLSGAGYPGVAALDITDNVIPFVEGEEEKMEAEPQKVLGTLSPQGIQPWGVPIHATCTRVAVRDGHTETVHVRFNKATTIDEVGRLLRTFRGPSKLQKLPTAPTRPVLVTDERDRPQPRRDRDAGAGMTVTIGRLRLSPDGKTLRMVILGHNTVRGAAGQSLMNAELCFTEGLL